MHCVLGYTDNWNLNKLNYEIKMITNRDSWSRSALRLFGARRSTLSKQILVWRNSCGPELSLYLNTKPNKLALPTGRARLWHLKAPEQSILMGKYGSLVGFISHRAAVWGRLKDIWTPIVLQQLVVRLLSKSEPDLVHLELLIPPTCHPPRPDQQYRTERKGMAEIPIRSKYTLER